MQQIWTEKYRPSSFSEFRGQNKIAERVKALVESKNIPNLLFAGPAGVGKSTLALITAKELFGEQWKENFLELNASDARGIDVVRGVIKDFARTGSLGSVPFKIIFLDECDSLTKEAQQALRRTMENFTHNVRFVLSANFSSKIIDPIQSRCTVFRFKPLEEEEIKLMMNKIANEEGLTINDRAMKAINEIADGDARRATNIIQSTAAINKVINDELVYNLVSAAKPKEISEFLTLAIQGNFIASRDKALDTMLKHGVSGIDLIKQIQKTILELELDGLKKASLIEKCGEIEFRMVEGSD
ncbi:MAG: replication factor C small subunit, partial [Candidatus Lokiarchaeota archaeon]|nr:replication factor C small subunit [Candidatus Lokiarchaeota archaeon]